MIKNALIAGATGLSKGIIMLLIKTEYYIQSSACQKKIQS
jgi:hypothetical protein